MKEIVYTKNAPDPVGPYSQAILTNNTLFISDLIKYLMEIKVVDSVTDIILLDSEYNKYSWMYRVKSSHIPSLDYKKTKIRFTSDGKEIFQSNLKAYSYDTDVVSNKTTLSKNSSSTLNRDDDLFTYSSIQNDFPEIFGIGEEGVHSRSDTTAIAKAKQLKGYLLLYDQF